MATRRRAPGDGGLHKRKDNSLWVGSVELPTADGRRRKKYVAAKDYKTAKAKLDELRDELRRGIIPVSTNTTVAVWLRYWVDQIKKPKVKPNTYDWYEEAVRLHIIPNIDSKTKLKALTPVDVRNMLGKIETSGNKQRAHKTLNLALKAAVDEGILGRNVATVVNKPEHAKKTRGSLGAAAAKRAIKAAIDLQESRDDSAPLVATRWVTAFLTGARPAEIIGLELDRVDLTAGVFDFSWQLQQLDKAHGCGEPVGTLPNGKPRYPCGKVRASFCPQSHWDFNANFVYRECIGSLVWTKPKSAAGRRVVPIVAPLQAMLEHHLAETADMPNPHGLVWRRAGGRPLTKHDDAKLWREVIAAAELPAVDVYAGRHTCATLLQELGIPAEVRMQIMGQSSEAAHAEYIHVDQTQTRAALAKLERILLS